MNDFLEFVAGIFEDDVKHISMETEYNQYEKWDSMAHLRLVMELEEKYQVQIPIDAVMEIKTLGQLYELIEGKR